MYSIDSKLSLMASLTNRHTFLQTPFVKKQQQPKFTPPSHYFYSTRSQFNWPNTSPLNQLKKLNLNSISYKKPQGLLTHTMTSSPEQSKYCLSNMRFKVTVLDVQKGSTSVKSCSLGSFMFDFNGLACAIECVFELNLIRISLFPHHRLLLSSLPTTPNYKVETFPIPYLLDSHIYPIWSYPSLEEIDKEEEEEESIYSCSSYSIIQSDEEYQDNDNGLSQLVQDTLNYIQSNGGAYTDELNLLVPKLTNYLSSS